MWLLIINLPTNKELAIFQIMDMHDCILPSLDAYFRVALKRTQLTRWLEITVIKSHKLKCNNPSGAKT